MKEDIPKKTVYRLSLYNRCLERLAASPNGTVSSETLARVAGVKPTQLRKDLAYCGQVGKRGLGYEIELLHSRLTATLGHTALQPVILIGAGNLGAALLRYTGFAREGFEIVAAFDTQPPPRTSDLPAPVFGMNRLEKFVREQTIKIAILCIPATTAQEVCNQLVKNGIQAILNFAPLILQVPENVTVNNVNLAIELESLGYFIK